MARTGTGSASSADIDSDLSIVSTFDLTISSEEGGTETG